jgi:hypothetical protein
MASAALSRRVRKVVAYLLCEMSDPERRAFHEGATRRRQLRGPARKVAGGDPHGGQNRPKLRLVSDA